MPPAIWLAQMGGETSAQGLYWSVDWVSTPVLTCLALSMAVNALVTGLIVFKILKVFLEVKATMTSVERSLGSTRGTKLRHAIFIIIESGMALFAIQLLRVAFSVVDNQSEPSYNSQNSLFLVIGIHQMLNVIIRSLHFYFFYFILIYW